MMIFSYCGLLGNFVILRHFFLILCFAYNCHNLYMVAFESGYLCLNKHSLSSKDLVVHSLRVLGFVKKFACSALKCSLSLTTNFLK